VNRAEITFSEESPIKQEISPNRKEVQTPL